MEYTLRYLFLLICLVSLIHPAYGSQTIPKLIWQHTFKSPVICICERHVMDLPVNQKDRFPIQAVLTRSQGVAFNTKGKLSTVISLHDYDKCTIASDTFILAGLKENQMHVFTSNKQRTTFQISEPQPEILPQHLYFELSPDGQYMVIVSWYSKQIYFYSINNKLFQKHQFDDLKNTRILFSKNGKQVFVHVPNHGDGNANGYLLCFNNQGDFLWKFNHEGCKARIDISNNNLFILSGRILYILTFQGQVIQQKQLLNHQMLSASKHASSFASLEKNTIYLHDYKTNQLIWEHSIKPFDQYNNKISTLLVKDRRQIICSILHDWHKIQSNSSLIMIDDNGSEIFRNQLNRIDNGLFLDAQKYLCVYGGNKVYLFDTNR